ncbi:MAG: hypothetical protein V1750_11355, partial [Acidobacteriota bacterium]
MIPGGPSAPRPSLVAASPGRTMTSSTCSAASDRSASSVARGDAAAFACAACGQESGKWLGRCPSCGSWNSFEEIPRERPAGRRA